MTMIAGSVAIVRNAQGAVVRNADGTPQVTGTGMALAIFQAYSAASAAFRASHFGMRAPTKDPVVQNRFDEFAQLDCDLANALASGIVPYIQANAVAHITTQSCGRDSDGANPPILAPAAPVDIPIT